MVVGGVKRTGVGQLVVVESVISLDRVLECDGSYVEQEGVDRFGEVKCKYFFCEVKVEGL